MLAFLLSNRTSALAFPAFIGVTMSAYKITYRIFGQKTTYELAAGPNQIGKSHVDPSNYVDVTIYTHAGDNLVKGDGGVDMKELKGHIRKEIGDSFYQFQEIVKVGETI